jgi:hypothetical protein
MTTMPGSAADFPPKLQFAAILAGKASFQADSGAPGDPE